jgi:O-antigen ligase
VDNLNSVRLNNSALVVYSLGSLVSLVFWLPHLDGFNIIKFSIVILLGFFALLVLLFHWKEFVRLISSQRSIVLISGLFISWYVLASFLAENSWKALFGETSRYVGLISYLSCILVFLLLSISRTQELQVVWLFKALSYVGVVEITYVIMQLAEIDPINWNTPYGRFIGTLGNSNFAGSFLSLCSVATLWLVINRYSKLSTRLLWLLVIASQQVAILIGGVRQGTLTALLGFGVIVLYQINIRYKGSRRVFYSSISLMSLGVFLLIAGMLQKGPLTTLIYKSSVSIRGDYWRAALRMIQDSPIVGFGPGSYGDYFAEYRDMIQVERSGINILADSAHNIFLDLSVSGGIPLALIYFVLILVIAKKLIELSKTTDASNRSAITGLSALWVVCAAQAMISVENLTFLIWNFIILGTLIGLDKREEKIEKTRYKSPGMAASLVIAGILSIILIQPLWRADTTLKKLILIPISEQSEVRIERLNMAENLVKTIPENSHYYQAAASALKNAGQIEAVNFAQKALELNSRDLRSLRILLQIYASTNDRVNFEKYRAIFDKLDPLITKVDP